MKRVRIKNVLPVLLFLLPFIASAQRHNDPQNFRLGFTASPTFGWLSFESGSSYSGDGLKTGFAYGLMGDFGFTDKYYFGTGFTLTTMSADTRLALTGATAQNISYKIQYIEVPLTLKLKTEPGTLGRFYAQFGPDLGVRMSTKHSLNNLAINDNAELIRLGVLVGAGSEWKWKTSDVLTGLSFNNPFTKAFTHPEAKNYIVTLNLGVFF